MVRTGLALGSLAPVLGVARAALARGERARPDSRSPRSVSSLSARLRPPLGRQVNHSPSFACDSPLDARIKSDLITNTMKLLNLHPLDRRRHQKQQQSQAQKRLYSGVTGPAGLRQQSTQRAANAVRTWVKYTKCEAQKLGNFSLIFPSSDPEKQQRFQVGPSLTTEP